MTMHRAQDARTHYEAVPRDGGKGDGDECEARAEPCRKLARATDDVPWALRETSEIDKGANPRRSISHWSGRFGFGLG